MTAALDIINRTKLMDLIEEVAVPDEIIMFRALLCNTILEVKLLGYERE